MVRKLRRPRSKWQAGLKPISAISKNRKATPDYAKPPASEYLKRIFDADALAALPAPKVDDFGWLLEWVTSVDQTYTVMLMFGAKNSGTQTAGRNLVDYQDNTLPAAAFMLRLNAYAVSRDADLS